MKRTRKWSYVAQEAGRLAGLGVSAAEIARRLEVNESSVSRWIKAGKLTISRQRRTAQGESDPDPLGEIAKSDPHPIQSPEQWAAEVRQTFALDPTDDQLVTAARLQLETMHDGNATNADRRAASTEFRAIVKQLALIGRGKASETPAEPEAPKRGPLQIVRRKDPRALLAVNE